MAISESDGYRAACQACDYSWIVDNEDEAGACENCNSDEVTVEPDERQEP